MFSSFSGRYSEEELMSYIVTLFSFLKCSKTAIYSIEKKCRDIEGGDSNSGRETGGFLRGNLFLRVGTFGQ